MTNSGQRHHDMGGLPAGAIHPAEHDPVLWEKRVDALMTLLGDEKRRLLRVDELRQGIEQLGPGAYDEMSYYERWIASIVRLLQTKGVITTDELGRKMAAVEAREAAAREAAD